MPGDLRVFWQRPSLGYDFGVEGARTMMLIYNLPATDVRQSGQRVVIDQVVGWYRLDQGAHIWLGVVVALVWFLAVVLTTRRYLDTL